MYAIKDQSFVFLARNLRGRLLKLIERNILRHKDGVEYSVSIIGDSVSMASGHFSYETVCSKQSDLSSDG